MSVLKQYDSTLGIWQTIGGMGLPKTPVSCSVHRNGVSQTAIPNSAHTKVLFTTKVYDNGNCYDLTNSRFQPQVAGLYVITGSLRVTVTFSNILAIALWKGSVSTGTIFGDCNGIASYGGGAEITRHVYLNGTTDYVEMSVYQNSGTTKDVYGNIEYTSFQACLIPDSYDATKQVVDLSSATTDYLLQVGETVVVNFTSATSIPLRIGTEEGLYEIILCNTDFSSTNYTINNLYLQPNNVAQTAGAINWNRILQYSTTVNGGESVTTETAFVVGNFPSTMCEFMASTFTKSKNVTGKFSMRYAADSIYTIHHSQPWFDTTTVWSSLGTLVCSTAFSGKVVIKRIV